MIRNPLRRELQNWLPEVDFGVMGHGFAPHGRDYDWIIEVQSGRYRLTLTHVVELRYETRVFTGREGPGTWDDRLTDYASAYAPGSPDGYVWGCNWSLAYPGLDAPDDDLTAHEWSKRVGKPMYGMSVETDRFKIVAIFHDCKSAKISEKASVISKVIFPL